MSLRRKQRFKPPRVLPVLTLAAWPYLCPSHQTGPAACVHKQASSCYPQARWLGREAVRDDFRAIHAVRASVGDAVHLMVDFNQGLELAEAFHRCHMIDDLGLDWIEEPIVYDNFDGFARLSAELKTPIQIGENFYGVRDLHRALQMKACDLVMPDFMRIGGVTGWLRAAAMAEAAGVPISTHLYPEVAAQVMRVTETAHWLE